MDLELDKILSPGMDADGFASRAEIIPLVTKDDESFLLYEEEIPDDMPLLPLRDNVLFPGVVMPITVGRKSSLQLLRMAERKNMRIIVVAQKNDVEEPTIADLNQIGVIARVLRVIDLPHDNTLAVLQGTMKCLLSNITQTTPFYHGQATLIDENEKPSHPRSFHNRVLAIRRRYAELQQKKNNGSGFNTKDIINSLSNIGSDRILINYIAAHLDISSADKQQLLDAYGYERRADMVAEFIENEHEFFRIRDDIQDKTRQEMDRQQREYYLNQQMRVIQDELGGSSSDQELHLLQERAAKKHWSKAVGEAFDHSIEKLRRTPPQTPDYTVELNYAELLLELPWEEYSKDGQCHAAWDECAVFSTPISAVIYNKHCGCLSGV